MSRKQCIKCECTFRPATTPKAKAPGTKLHGANGLCKACYYLERKAAGVVSEAVDCGPVFDERVAVSALEAWLGDRRRRIAKGTAV